MELSVVRQVDLLHAVFFSFIFCRSKTHCSSVADREGEAATGIVGPHEEVLDGNL